MKNFFTNRILSVPPTPHTMVSFTPKKETMQNVKNPKKIVRLNLIDVIMWSKTGLSKKTTCLRGRVAVWPKLILEKGS